MAGALAARHTDKELEKGRVDTTRVRRYWPGKAPAWAPQDEEELAREVQRTAIAPVIVRRTDDPRLARLAQRRDSRDEGLEERRQIRAPEVVRRRHAASDEEAESEEEDQQQQADEQEIDEEALQRRREALKARYRIWY